MFPPFSDTQWPSRRGDRRIASPEPVQDGNGAGQAPNPVVCVSIEEMALSHDEPWHAWAALFLQPCCLSLRSLSPLLPLASSSFSLVNNPRSCHLLRPGFVPGFVRERHPHSFLHHPDWGPIQADWPRYILPSLLHSLWKSESKPSWPQHSCIRHACKTSTTWRAPRSAVSWRSIQAPRNVAAVATDCLCN